MARFVAAIVFGYLVMLGAVIGIFAFVYPLIGADNLFHPGSYEAARGWIVLGIGVSLLAAMAGGAVCARISPRTEAPLWLAAIVLVLGGLKAIPALTKAESTRGGSRPSYVSITDAMANAQQPAWAALLNPIVGALGILMGAGPRAVRE
jgi:quinol-cytochrome oxidoreductase complex cytochrome b subunit